MPRFSANLWYLFQELDLMDRFGAAAKAGFKAVEIQFPYQWRGADLAERLRQRTHELVRGRETVTEARGGDPSS